MKVSTSFAHHVPTDIRENLRWKAKIHRRVMDDPAYAEVIWDACKQDPIFYVNGFVYTYDPRREPFPKVPMILFPFQVDGLSQIIRALNAHDIFVEKSRDMGASWLCILALEWAWHFHDDLAFLMGSRVEDYVDKTDNPKALFWKIDFLHRHLPKWLMPPGYTSAYRSKLHIFNPYTGSVIDGESTTENFARGARLTAILLDEFAAVDQGHQILGATRDATNCRIFNSTPAGIANAYYDVRQTGIRKLRFHWSEHPLKNPGLYTTAKDGTLKVLDKEGYPDRYRPTLDGKLRSPWYDIQFDRAASPREIAEQLDIDYLGSGYQYFSAEAIQRAIRRFACDPILVGDLEYDSVTAEPIRFREHQEGRLKLWCLLNRDGSLTIDHPVVIGGDVSAGTGSSNSCLCAYDATTNEKLAEYANPYIRPEEFARQAVALAQWLNKAYLIWENNGVGRQFGSRVVELGYGNIHYRRREEAISKKVSDVPGWASTIETKLVLMGSYRAGVENSKIVNRSKIALEETLEYIFDAKGGVAHSRENSKTDPTGAKKNHGDRVMADALAQHGLTARRTAPPKLEKQKAPYGSLAWRMEQRRQAEQSPGRELLHSEGWG